MKISEIIEKTNRKYEKGSLYYENYEIICCDDDFGIALVTDKTSRVLTYIIAVLGRFYRTDRTDLDTDYYLNFVRTFFEKEKAEKAYKALVAR